MAGNDKTDSINLDASAGTTGGDCIDGLCSVKPRKLGMIAEDKPTAPAARKRPFLIDMLHGDVDLERLFGSK